MVCWKVGRFLQGEEQDSKTPYYPGVLYPRLRAKTTRGVHEVVQTQDARPAFGLTQARRRGGVSSGCRDCLETVPPVNTKHIFGLAMVLVSLFQSMSDTEHATAVQDQSVYII